MKNIFDYTYYRTAKRHFKRDGASGFTAILALSFIVFLYTIVLYTTLFNISNFKIINISDKFEKAIFIILALLSFFFVREKYKGKYFLLRDKWINESKKEKLLGEVLILLFFFSPLIFKFLFDYLLAKI